MNKEWAQMLNDFDREIRNEYTLCGDFHCKLTINELNDWSDYIRKNPTYLKYIVAKHRMDAAIYTNSAVEEFTILMLEDLNELNLVAKDWFDKLQIKRLEAEKHNKSL